MFPFITLLYSYFPHPHSQRQPQAQFGMDLSTSYSRYSMQLLVPIQHSGMGPMAWMTSIPQASSLHVADWLSLVIGWFANPSPDTLQVYDVQVALSSAPDHKMNTQYVPFGLCFHSSSRYMISPYHLVTRTLGSFSFF